VEPYNGSDTWIDKLLGNPDFKARVVAEVRAVAEEVARDIEADEAALGPDEAARQRFREFARRRLETSN